MNDDDDPKYYSDYPRWLLEAKQILILLVSHLLQRRKNRLLNHRRRSTKQRDIILPRSKDTPLQNILIHMSFLPVPVVTGMRKHMGKLELIRMILRHLVQLVSQEDIILCLIRIDNLDLRLVFRLVIRRGGHQYPRQKLVSGRDTRSTQNETDIPETQLLVVDLEFSLSDIPDLSRRALDLDFFAGSQTVQDVTHGTAWLGLIGEIGLDEEVECAVFFMYEDWTGWRVRSDDDPVREMESQLDMLAGFET